MPRPIIPESNVIRKNWSRVDLKIALCYPNVYRAGMTGLPIRLLYALLNSRDDVACERFFIPTRNEGLVSLESQRPLKDFDIIAFSLQYEEDYINVLRMLLESEIPVRREDRYGKGPLIIAGGPCATENPEPLADYIDLFVIGEVEPILDELIERIKELENPTRRIEEFADLNGIYIPKIHNSPRRVWIRNLDDAPHPLAQQVPLVDSRSPYMTIFGRTLAVEVARGCNRGCKFCLIGCISRPKRERSLKRLEEIIEEGMRYTPAEKVSLIGAGLSDYSRLEELCEYIVSQGWKISIPSLRPDRITERLAKAISKGKQRTVAIAPEAGTQRLRDLISKGLNEEQIIDAARTLLECGIKRIKLYFIIGLPSETHYDVKAIASLSKKVAELGYGKKSVHISINPLIPKPHTPFQFEPFASLGYIRKCLKLIKTELSGDARFVLSGIDPRRAQIQAALSLGDRKLGKVIELTARYGGGLGAWRRALNETNVKIENYLRRKSSEEKLPWSHIQIDLNSP